MLGQAISRLTPSQFDFLSPTRQELDLLDRAAVRNYFKHHKIDGVIHCAGKVGGIVANMTDPTGFMVRNILINTHVIEEARLAGISHLVNIGSSCMYPRDFARPLKEVDLLSAPLEPTNENYALAKIAAARLCEAVSNQYQLHYKTFVPCNMYGLHDTYDLNNGHLLSSAILKITEAKKKNSPSVEIWGDGTARREFVFADDVAEFILNNFKNLSSLPPMLNLGMGRDYTVTEYYQMVANAVGYSGKFIYNTDKPVGMTRKLMDCTLAENHGWRAGTDMQAGLEKVCAQFA